MKPKQTEYKGTVFRSKSEAMLAYCFDNAGLEYEYEPEIKCDGSEWIPDFLICDKLGHIILLEYKPCSPTKTYIDWLHKEWNKLKRIDVSNISWLENGTFVDSFILLEHDFYQRKGQVSYLPCWPYYEIGRLFWNLHFKDSFWIHGDKALNYRFDLQSRYMNHAIKSVDNEPSRYAEMEFLLLVLLLNYDELPCLIKNIFNPDWITDPKICAAIKLVIQAHKEKKWEGGEVFLDGIGNPDIEKLIAKALTDLRPIQNKEKRLIDALTCLRNQWLIKQIRELAQQMDDPDCDPEQMVEIMQQRQTFEKMRRKHIDAGVENENIAIRSVENDLFRYSIEN